MPIYLLFLGFYLFIYLFPSFHFLTKVLLIHHSYILVDYFPFIYLSIYPNKLYIFIDLIDIKINNFNTKARVTREKGEGLRNRNLTNR